MGPHLLSAVAVDGCSVIVEGSRGNPTVYHLNNMGGGAPPLGGTLVDNQNYWNPKKNTMEGRFQTARSPKSVREAAAGTPGAAPVVAAKGVHALDYLDMTEAQRGTYETPVIIQGAFQEAKNKALDALSWIYTGSDYKPFGTVFGWKHGGNWTFYYQRRATMWYKYRATFASKPPTLFIISRQMSWHLDEFWPNGSGVAVAKALVP